MVVDQFVDGPLGLYGHSKIIEIDTPGVLVEESQDNAFAVSGGHG